MKSAPTLLSPRLIAAILALSAASLAPARAVAQAPKDLAAARRAFREGEEAEAKGDNATALARFQAALAVKSTPQLHLRVGAVEERLGKLRDALASYRRGLELAASLPAVAAVAREQIDTLTPRIPTLTLTLAKPVPGLAVTLDGAPIAAADLGSAILVDPGPHQLHAEAPGRAAHDQSFDAAPRGSTRITIDLVPLVPAAAPSAGTGASRLPGALAAAGGAAALVAGAVLIGVSVAKDGSIDALCGGSDRLRCPLSKKDQIEGDVRTVNAMRFSGIGAAVIGAAGAAVGTYLLVKANKAAPAAGAVTVTPLLGAGTTGIGVAGRF